MVVKTVFMKVAIIASTAIEKFFIKYYLAILHVNNRIVYSHIMCFVCVFNITPVGYKCTGFHRNSHN